MHCAPILRPYPRVEIGQNDSPFIWELAIDNASYSMQVMQHNVTHGNVPNVRYAMGHI